jgi:hypothetical protein
MQKKYLLAILTIFLVACFCFILFLFNQRPEKIDPSYENLSKAEEKGIQFLKNRQLHSGEFATTYSFNKQMIPSFGINSNFITTFVVHSLEFSAQRNGTFEMREKAIDFLEKNKNDKNYWNFYAPNAIILLFGNVPDDLDCTASAAAEISEKNNQITSNFDKFKSRSGTYYTWTEKINYYGGNDIDCVVNTNILFYYSIIRKEDQNLCSYLNNIIKTKNYQKCTNYYTTSFAFTYAITRAFADANASCIKENLSYVKDFLLKSQKEGSWGNDLDNALATASLINIGFKGEELDLAMSKILARQNFYGAWDNAGFFRGHCFGDYCIYFGSEELTTAISLETIAKYKKQLN